MPSAICDDLEMKIETVLYEPPKDGLPYLVVTFTPNGIEVETTNSRTEARAMIAKRAAQLRRARTKS